MSDWQHDQLAEDLAAHLKAPDRMVWLNMQLGPRGSPRPDVYTIYKSYVRPQPTAYEVKISREDFRSDIFYIADYSGCDNSFHKTDCQMDRLHKQDKCAEG